VWKKRTVNDKSSFFTGERVLAMVLGAGPTVFALLVLRAQVFGGFDLLGAIFGSAFASLAALCWWVFVKGAAATKTLPFRSAVLGGIILGGISFLAGFLGPIIFTPGANQGPLLGIFITGPAGFVIGMVAGLIYGKYRSKATTTPNQAL